MVLSRIENLIKVLLDVHINNLRLNFQPFLFSLFDTMKWENIIFIFAYHDLKKCIMYYVTVKNTLKCEIKRTPLSKLLLSKSGRL